MALTQKEIQKLITAATKARAFAFAHRSKHKIGASVLTADGQIFGGCNIESVISGLGSCAERTAIDHAIVHGCYNIRAVCTMDEGLTPRVRCLPPVHPSLLTTIGGRNLPRERGHAQTLRSHAAEHAAPPRL